MADINSISSSDEFSEAIVSNDNLNLSKEGAEELWRVWQFRYENGAEDDILVALPSWFARDEFGKERPYFFAKIERDEESSGAILFKDARLIDINVVENEIWDEVTISETLEVLDISDGDDYIDEAGKLWTPRSLMTMYEMDTSDSNDSDDSEGLTGISGP